ncbi:MAG: lipid-A-disaccharide synthase [Cyanobacteria bacterium J083]|nr:MAG: lipid-A-disaccharide synthase [Cyanobacteria bacterium J083]
MPPLDILILTNGPGEVTTWVFPVVKAIREQLGNDSSQVRISLILSPCPNATGKEAMIAASYPQVNRVQAAEDFFPFLLWGKTKDNWDWRSQGIVLFLGGDQFFAVLAGKRLGYKTLVYAEWEARWYRWIDHFLVMNQQVINKLPNKYQKKCTLVGDLMAEAAQYSQIVPQKTVIIGLLPGSKPAKLAQGVPLCLSIADLIHQTRPHIEFFMPIAPTLDLPTLEKFANSATNSLVEKMGRVEGKLFQTAKNNYLITKNNLKIRLITKFPAYTELAQSQLCITTVGANTAELGSLAIPMIVLLPTQQLDAMRAWDGIPGILANLPGLGSIFAKLINLLVIKQGKLFAWPNKWADKEIVPELIGNLQPAEIKDLVVDFLDNPAKLAQIRQNLLKYRGKSGAAAQIALKIAQDSFSF